MFSCKCAGPSGFGGGSSRRDEMVHGGVLGGRGNGEEGAGWGAVIVTLCDTCLRPGVERAGPWVGHVGSPQSSRDYFGPYSGSLSPVGGGLLRDNAAAPPFQGWTAVCGPMTSLLRCAPPGTNCSVRISQYRINISQRFCI